MIALVGGIGRVVLEMTAPDISHVDIGRVAISLELPHAGNVDFAPCAVVEVGLVEVGRTLVGVLYKLELPLAVEREKIGRLGLGALERQVTVLIREELGVQWETVYRVYLQVLPFSESGRHVGRRH